MYLLYQTFGSDMIDKRIKTFKETSQGKTAAERVAQVKLISDDPKDIEKFITANARYLSDRVVKQLVSRIELIKCDRIIADDSVRTRIAAFPQEEEVVEIPNVMRRTR